MTRAFFFQRVYKVVSKIPKGRVATYGQIAAAVSSPRAARQVGLALRNLGAGSKVPWHRVINQQGMISIENLAVPKAEQARRLQKEGIKVEFRDGNCLKMSRRDSGRIFPNIFGKIPNPKY